jgi:hypothetical protein
MKKQTDLEKYLSQNKFINTIAEKKEKEILENILNKKKSFFIDTDSFYDYSITYIDFSNTKKFLNELFKNFKNDKDILKFFKEIKEEIEKKDLGYYAARYYSKNTFISPLFVIFFSYFSKNEKIQELKELCSYFSFTSSKYFLFSKFELKELFRCIKYILEEKNILSNLEKKELFTSYLEIPKENLTEEEIKINNYILFKYKKYIKLLNKNNFSLFNPNDLKILDFLESSEENVSKFFFNKNMAFSSKRKINDYFKNLDDEKEKIKQEEKIMNILIPVFNKEYGKKGEKSIGNAYELVSAILSDVCLFSDYSKRFSQKIRSSIVLLLLNN